MQSSGWHTSPLDYGAARKLSEALGISGITASVLARRGYHTPAAARRFLSADAEFYSPFLFPEMERVRDRLLAAAATGEQICVYGDYDVDGITSTALLVSVLRELGGNVSWRLPNRFTDGYGVATTAVEQIAAGGAGLLVTVDCGISAREALARARDLGLETIVVDHHRPAQGELPPGLIISPLLCDYPFKELAGVGLAFKVAQALVSDSGENNALNPMLARQLDLVALGTIADVVPLLDENRSLVRRGLVQMARTRRPGLQELMRVGLVEQARVNAGLVAFRLAPRINAAGRLEDPAPALELLLTEDGQEAAKLADHLDSLNRERQKLENRMVAEAVEQLGALSGELRNRRGYVLSAPGWHEGVIGIVASRMVEMHHRPVIMISENGGYGKGSGRSIPAFDLHGSLLALSQMLIAFGGHRAACGLTISLEQIPEFQRRFAELAGAALSPADLAPSCYVDALVCGRELTLNLTEELAQLEPFGLGNPAVSLMAPGSQIVSARSTKDGRHLQCLVEAGGARSSAIGFGQSFLVDKISDSQHWDVAFRLERNEWAGSVAPQLNLREIFPRPGKPPHTAETCSGRCDRDCPERIRSEEFWPLFRQGAPLPPGCRDGRPAATLLEDRVIDRRGFGDIRGQIAQLISTGENVLLLVADLPRRRQLLAGLPLESLGAGRLLLAGSRCSSQALSEKLANNSPASPSGSGASTLGLTDFATASASAALTSGFDHLVFVDPPFSNAILGRIASLAPDAYVHLLPCDDEVQFTRRVLEHEYSLRVPLIKLYKRLDAEKTYPLDEITMMHLLAGGKYLRQPATVARCLAVLQELALVSVEDNEGKPMMSLRAADRSDLAGSATFRENQAFYEECLKYLSKSPKVIIS